MIQGIVLLLPAPERGVGSLFVVGTNVGRVTIKAVMRLNVMMIRKPTERVPPFSELFADALIECFLAWSTARAVAVLNLWALLRCTEALSLGVSGDAS